MNLYIGSSTKRSPAAARKTFSAGTFSYRNS
jgi:hypothetical protein